MQKHGGDVYRHQYRMDYSVNINPLGPPESVIEAACLGVRCSDRYPDVECQRLRQKLAEKEKVPPEQLIFGNGAADLIFMLTLAEKPGTVLIPAPSFSEYEQAVSAVKGHVIYYPLKETSGFTLDRDILEWITPEVDMLFLCSPNNPVGLPVDPGLALEILEQCEACHTLLVMDECFNPFLEDGDSYSMKKYVNRHSGLFILKAFTKIYAMPGLRLGYGISSGRELLNRMKEVSQPWNVSVPAQFAGEAALEEKTVVEQFLRMLPGERQFLTESLGKLGFQVFDSKANYILFRADPRLYQSLADRGILIRDCSNYQGLSEGYFRIAVRTREDNKELIRTIEEVVTEWQSQ